MPDHLHAIIRIKHRLPRDPSGADRPSRLRRGTLGAIIGQFKSVATKRIRAAGHHAFAWQPRFHESVIRNEDQLEATRRYIANNPRKWRNPPTFPKPQMAGVIPTR